MVFSSIIFILFFLPAFFLTYYLVPRKARNTSILVYSLIFYAWGAPTFIYYLVSSTLLNYFLVRWMDNASEIPKKKFFLALSILLNVGLLFYFKYANFFIENVNFFRTLFGFSPMDWVPVILPIGISFFTFQSITYSVDAYRKVHAPLKNPFDYMLYIMMFPQMLAGPIVRFQQIADQIESRKEKTDQILYGFYRFALGLSKKVLIADVLASEVDRILSVNYATLDSSQGWIAILAYTFQLYFDFSGYSDMAIGMGRMMGFKFPENFDNPYVARTVSEFWRRWHMTFSVFMRNYLYYPLGGSRVKTKRRLYFNLWFVFLISGLWHGASWNFVIYGAFHGMFMVMDRLFLTRWMHAIGRIPSVLFTFFVIVIARVFFRIEKLSDAVEFLKVLFKFDFQPLEIDLKAHFFVIMVAASVFSWITLTKFGLWAQEKIYSDQLSLKKHAIYWPASILAIIISISSLTGFGFSPFIYFRF